MTEQELFEKMNQWARIHGIPLDAREGKIKEEEPPFALPVGILGEDVRRANQILEEAGGRPKRLDSLSKKEILAALAAEESLGHKLVPGMLTPPADSGTDRQRIVPPQGGSGTARPVPLQAKPNFAGPYSRWLHQLWNNPAENWHGILRDAISEHMKIQREEHADELRKMHEELEKLCKQLIRKAVSGN